MAQDLRGGNVEEQNQQQPAKKPVMNVESLTKISKVLDKEWDNMDAADKRYVLSRFIARAKADGVNVEGL